MVGGLIEQQEIRSLQQQLRQRNAHLPAAGKFFRIPLPIITMEAKPCKDLSHFHFEGVAVASRKLVLQPLVTICHGGILGTGMVKL